MPEIPNLFISRHAVEQFRQRIAPMSEARTLVFIREGIRHSMNFNLLPDGNTLRIRTRRPFPFEFRAYCVFDKERGHFVVTTIVRGDSNVNRKRKRKAARNPSPPDVAPAKEHEVAQDGD
jgi:hypothetical protein